LIYKILRIIQKNPFCGDWGKRDVAAGLQRLCENSLLRHPELVSGSQDGLATRSWKSPQWPSKGFLEFFHNLFRPADAWLAPNFEEGNVVQVFRPAPLVLVFADGSSAGQVVFE
jgi:hypothetical protein